MQILGAIALVTDGTIPDDGEGLMYSGFGNARECSTLNFILLLGLDNGLLLWLD